MFDGMENRIAAIVFGIPAVKGIAFGSGFEGSRTRGSQNNDAFILDGDAVRRERTTTAASSAGSPPACR